MNIDVTDYGCDPLGNNQFKMIPSGRIVNKEEKDKILSARRTLVKNEIFGMTWDELERKQGGKLNRNVINS